MDRDFTPTTSDFVIVNNSRVRIEHVGTGEYAIAVVTPEGGRFEMDRGELTLTIQSRGNGVPAVWTCWTDENGRRA